MSLPVFSPFWKVLFPINYNSTYNATPTQMVYGE